jgi:hypothetical protein
VRPGLLCVDQSVCAQSSQAATSGLPVANGTPLPLTLATVIAFVPDKTIQLQIGTGDPVQYNISKCPVYVGVDGSVVDSSVIQPGATILVHFMTDGDATIIDRMFLQ